MRIHTKLGDLEMFHAAAVAGVTFHRIKSYGSKTHPRAYDVILTGSASHKGGWRKRDYQAATWDEWGMFLGTLYARDAEMVCAGVYASAEHFHWATGHRFGTRPPRALHARHTWEWAGTACTGAYTVHMCSQPTCRAVRRSLVGGRTFASLGN